MPESIQQPTDSRSMEGLNSAPEEVMGSEGLLPQDDAINAIRNKIHALETAEAEENPGAPRGDLSDLQQKWVEYGGEEIERAEAGVNALNFRSDAYDHVRAKYRLRDAKQAFYDNLRGGTHRSADATGQEPEPADTGAGNVDKNAWSELNTSERLAELSRLTGEYQDAVLSGDDEEKIKALGARIQTLAGGLIGADTEQGTAQSRTRTANTDNGGRQPTDKSDLGSVAVASLDTKGGDDSTGPATDEAATRTNGASQEDDEVSAPEPRVDELDEEPEATSQPAEPEEDTPAEAEHARTGELSTAFVDSIWASVRGASHETSGKPNQDAVLVEKLQAGGSEAVLAAVSDGHGSDTYFRSDRGSQLTTRVVNQVIKNALAEVADTTYALPERLAKDEAFRNRIKSDIAAAWRDAVDLDMQQEPIEESEKSKLSPDKRKKVEDDPRKAYGSTLLATLQTEKYTLVIQLGDGDISILGDDSTVGSPIPQDSNQIANETNSMCDSNAASKMHINVVYHDTPPELVCLSTDGLSNSYSDIAGFHKFMSDVANYDDVAPDQLAGWLERISAQGAGDDTTAALLFRK